MELNREQIVKALEICAEDTPYPDQSQALLDAIALIKQLAEENEKIGIENFDLICELSRIKADTVRKMQERLHERFKSDPNLVYSNYNIHRYIDQIAKEMLEGADED